MVLNPVLHDIGKQKKMAIFRASRGQLLKDSMSWAGCQNNPIDVNFHLQKSLENFENLIQKGQGKVFPPMANRFKVHIF